MQQPIERIMFVDENDQPIGAGPREEAWENNMYVRIVRVILRDENGRMLSQHRGPDKKSYPNCWTDSASGHVDEGESYDFAVSRELEEELGISIPLKFVGRFKSADKDGKRVYREFNAVYEGRIDSGAKLVLEKDHISEVKWFEIQEFKSLIEQNPKNFTLGVRETMKRFY